MKDPRSFLSPRSRKNLLLTLLLATAVDAASAHAADLKTMTTGLGAGTVVSTPAGINCGADCTETYGPAVSVTLTATAAAGSTFTKWDGDCSGTAPTCTFMMTSDRSVRAEFGLTTAIPTITDFSPVGLQNYLTANPSVSTPARFLKALPQEFKQNWLLMSRSESLQTGTAETPRFLLPSANLQQVYTFGIKQSSSYPGAHPNAIEYMQWDPAQKNFRFHEIVLDAIPAIGQFPARARGVSIDDPRCSKCHSTRNIVNDGTVVGTTGIPPGSVKAKYKPNWDTYDSWGGLLPFNRDRIYQGSLEAAAFRKIFDPWTWSTNEPIRQFVEQLELQPPGVPASDAITRTVGGRNDGHVNFAFDASPPVLVEPAPSGTSTSTIAYSFDGQAGSGGTPVTRGGTFTRLHHSATPTDDEGRAVQFFDLLGGADGNLNQLRIADELVSHRWATGSVPIDVRPVTLAILKGCLSVSGTMVTATPALTIPLAAFFDVRNGVTIDQVVTDTGDRMKNLPRRKADNEKFNLDRSGDRYVFTDINTGLPDPNDPATKGLIQLYGDGTSQGTSATLDRIRQEVFRRPIDLGVADTTVMGGVYVDREIYSPDTVQRALLRYFLEPLGVSVDKWSMGVRGRSRTYTFADVFGTYRATLTAEIQASLTSDPYPGLAAFDCPALIPAVNSSLAASVLPGANDTPRYTDVQRIFNKACIECHGGLGYPPFSSFHDVTYLDLSENEDPIAADRLTRPHMYATMFTNTSPANSIIFERITSTSEVCPLGMMPCGGPPLSQTDIETIKRWIVGARPRTEGDPHIKTVDGTDYDFQAAGEFVLLRGEGLEIQARQTAVVTEAPLPPNAHTGLSSCVSVNTAAAVRVGPHRITYQPRPNGTHERAGFQLKIDGKPVDRIGEIGVALDEGGRVLATTEGGVQIEYPGGTDIVITPGWWAPYQVGYLNIDVRHARAVDGVMGAIAPQNWLPALPDGKLLGPQPADMHQRYVDLYETFADAWRVTAQTSLFEYAPGTTSDNFSIRSWPGQEPRSCAAVNEPGVLVAQPPAGKPPVKPVAAEVAQRYCHDVADAERRAHCEQDVMLTGEPGFAQTYLAAEKIQRNGLPEAPVLLGPPDDQENVDGTVQLTWRSTTDPEGDPLLYLQCLWAAGEMPTFDKCKRVMPPTEGTGGVRGRWLALLVGAMLAALLVWRVTQSVAAVGVLLLAAVALGGLGLRRTPPPPTDAMTMSTSASGLRGGTAYFWKVVVQDGHGGTVDSKTRRFATRR